MKSNTCDTPTWNWSAIGGTQGLFSAFKIALPVYKSNFPVKEK